MSNKKKNNKNLLLIGGAIAAAILAAKVLGKSGSDGSDGDGFGVGGGSAGGQDAYGGTGGSAGGADYVSTNGGYDDPSPTTPTFQAPISSISAFDESSTSLGYINPSTGKAVALTKTSSGDVDRFGYNPETGGFIDRMREQSIAPTNISNFEKAGYFLQTGQQVGFPDDPAVMMWNNAQNLDPQGQSFLPTSSAFDVAGGVDTSQPMSTNDAGNLTEAAAFTGLALGSNLALQKSAEVLSSKWGGLPKTPQGSFANMINDPYGVSSAKTTKKGFQEVGESALKKGVPKWAKIVGKGANFIPLLDVPIGAALDKRFMRDEEFAPTWGQAFSANVAGEGAQLGVTAMGAAAGGWGAIPAFVLGTGADIGATEASYAVFRARAKKGKGGSANSPKKSSSLSSSAGVSSSRTTRTGKTSSAASSSKANRTARRSSRSAASSSRSTASSSRSTASSSRGANRTARRSSRQARRSSRRNRRR